MDLYEKIFQVSSFIRMSSKPLPLILDLLRLKSRDYVAECKGLKFQLEAGSFEWFTILENLIREDYFSDGIQVSEGATVIDIGANFGSFSILASKMVGPTGKVIAFEPSQSVFNRLVENIALNNVTNIQAFREAVSDKDGFISFHMHKRTAFNTLLKSVDQRSNENATVSTVKTRSINRVISDLNCDVDLLKIDCEGAEYQILSEFSPDLASCVRQISMEVHKVDGNNEREIGLMLRKLGFIVHEALPKVTAVRSD